MALVIISSGCILSSPPETVSRPLETGAPPTIQLFSVSQNAVIPGGAVELIWQVTGADSVSIDNGIGNVQSKGVVSIKPATTMLYTLNAVNRYGNSAATASITITPDPYPTPSEPGTLPAIPGWNPPVINKFAVTPFYPEYGKSYTLNWNVSGVSAVTIEPGLGNVPPVGSANLTLSKATLFELNAVANDGSYSYASLPIGCNPFRSPYVKSSDYPEPPAGTGIYKGLLRGVAGGGGKTYSFVQRAKYATWINGSGLLRMGENADDINNTVTIVEGLKLEDKNKYDNVLCTYPQNILNGIVYGYFIELSNFLNYFGCGGNAFRSRIGFTGSTKGAKARFQVVVRTETKPPIVIYDVIKECDGKLLNISVNVIPHFWRYGNTKQGPGDDEVLKQDIYLRVEHIGSPGESVPVWVEPHLYCWH